MSDNPFDEAPQAASGSRNGFGTLRLSVKNIVLLAGDPGYTILGVMNPKEKTIWVFKGKKVVEPKANKHVVMIVARTDKNGNAYNAWCDFMYWENDEACKIALPALRQHFGKNLAGIVDKTAEVQYEEVSFTDTGGDGVERQRRVFKVTQVFADKGLRMKAEKEYFARVGETAEARPGNRAVDLAEWKEFIPEMRAAYDAALVVSKDQADASAIVVKRFDPRGKEGLTPAHIAQLLGLPL